MESLILKTLRLLFLYPDVELKKETKEDRDLFWAYGGEGMLVVICPFPLNRYGLNSHKRQEAFGSRIKELLTDASSIRAASESFR